MKPVASTESTWRRTNSSSWVAEALVARLEALVEDAHRDGLGLVLPEGGAVAELELDLRPPLPFGHGHRQRVSTSVILISPT